MGAASPPVSTTKPGSFLPPVCRRSSIQVRMRAPTRSTPSSLPVAALTRRIACGVDHRTVPLLRTDSRCRLAALSATLTLCAEGHWPLAGLKHPCPA